MTQLGTSSTPKKSSKGAKKTQWLFVTDFVPYTYNENLQLSHDQFRVRKTEELLVALNRLQVARVTMVKDYQMAGGLNIMQNGECLRNLPEIGKNNKWLQELCALLKELSLSM
jgi:hypothetical protein